MLHERAHEGPSESRSGLRIARGLAVRSARHRLTGFCDIVEIRDKTQVTPIEYKRGKPKPHRADEIQLCGQAICLEETFNLPADSIQVGFLFYGQRKRRTEIVFDSELRELTLSIAGRVRKMVLAGETPIATYAPKLCDACSLKEHCQPQALSSSQKTKDWFQREARRSLSK